MKKLKPQDYDYLWTDYDINYIFVSCYLFKELRNSDKIIKTVFSDKMAEEIAKVGKGDILVAETTGPEMIIACKKAGAIITDEGGTTSHAAVVSREFGIPCIIGTKIATKVLKDGDLVEVDAEKGVVRKLKIK